MSYFSSNKKPYLHNKNTKNTMNGSKNWFKEENITLIRSIETGNAIVLTILSLESLKIFLSTFLDSFFYTFILQ